LSRQPKAIQAYMPDEKNVTSLRPTNSPNETRPKDQHTRTVTCRGAVSYMTERHFRPECTPESLATRDYHENHELAPRLAQTQCKLRHPWLRRAVILTSIAFVGLLLGIIAFRFVSPPITPVMIADRLSGKSSTRNWVKLANISRELRLAVIASEDSRFCKNWGVEWREVLPAIKAGRGASTITMQVAKNLYLWPQRSYARKMLEVPLAYLLSALWSKTVIMETYLNIAPWGPGIVGAEAASQYFFHKSAAALTRREAILLAKVLPSPSRNNAGKPTPEMLKAAQQTDDTMDFVASRSACVLP